jgi:hypothetical protein
MKQILVTDEVYEFLMDLSKEINTQDNRSTADPYFYQIQEKKRVPSSEGCGEKAWYCDGTMLTTDEDEKEAIFEYNDWDLDSEEHQKLYSKMDESDREAILSGNYREVWYEDTEEYSNFFLTERDCEKHIKLNCYHYNQPRSYVKHAFRSYEFEKVIKFLKGLSELKDGE